MNGDIALDCDRLAPAFEALSNHMDTWKDVYKRRLDYDVFLGLQEVIGSIPAWCGEVKTARAFNISEYLLDNVQRTVAAAISNATSGDEGSASPSFSFSGTDLKPTTDLSKVGAKGFFVGVLLFLVYLSYNKKQSSPTVESEEPRASQEANKIVMELIELGLVGGTAVTGRLAFDKDGHVQRWYCLLAAILCIIAFVTSSVTILKPLKHYTSRSEAYRELDRLYDRLQESRAVHSSLAVRNAKMAAALNRPDTKPIDWLVEGQLIADQGLDHHREALVLSQDFAKYVAKHPNTTLTEGGVPGTSGTLDALSLNFKEQVQEQAPFITQQVELSPALAQKSNLSNEQLDEATAIASSQMYFNTRLSTMVLNLGKHLAERPDRPADSKEQSIKKVDDSREQAIQGREKAVQAREQSVERREQAVTRRDEFVKVRERAADGDAKLVERREKSVEQREHSVEQREKAAIDRERAIKMMERNVKPSTTTQVPESAAPYDDANSSHTSAIAAPSGSDQHPVAGLQADRGRLLQSSERANSDIVTAEDRNPVSVTAGSRPREDQRDLPRQSDKATQGLISNLEPQSEEYQARLTAKNDDDVTHE